MARHPPGTVLVTGFGPFLSVEDNPAERLARAVDGRMVAGHRVVGLPIPVSYARGPAETLLAVRRLAPALVIGIGVARAEAQVRVERRALAACGETPDIDGFTGDLSGGGQVAASIDCAGLAAGLGAVLSDDAGRYVCNAWLHEVGSRAGVPVGFVHVPPEGLEPERLLRGIASLLSGASGS